MNQLAIGGYARRVQRMTIGSIRLVKNGKHKELEAEPEPPDGLNRCFATVRSWVVEFQQQRPDKPLQAFDNLFKDALDPRGAGDQ